MKHLNWHLGSLSPRAQAAKPDARPTTSCSNINLDPLLPRPLPSLHLRGGRGPKIMAGFQQFRLGFNVARGINGAPTKRSGGRARRWRFAALTQPPPNPEESLDKRRRLPSLGEKRTKIPGRDKLSRTAAEEDDAAALTAIFSSRVKFWSKIAAD